MRSRVITKIITETILFNNKIVSQPIKNIKCFFPVICNEECRDERKYDKYDYNENPTIVEAATELSKMVHSGYIETICEIRIIYKHEVPQIDKVNYFHCAWKENYTWNEISSLDYKDILLQIKLLQMPDQPIKYSDKILLSPNFIGNIFHEFAHSLEIDHAPQARQSIGKNVFGNKYGKYISLYENPSKNSFGKHIFSDTGILQKKTVLVKNGMLISCLGNYETGDNLYAGFGGTGLLSPRTVCLEIKGPPSSNAPYEGSIILGSEMSVLLMRPRELLLWINYVDICNYKDGDIYSLKRINLDKIVPLNDIIDNMSFVYDCNLYIPKIGGICVKGNAKIRSVQHSGFALFKNILF